MNFLLPPAPALPTKCFPSSCAAFHLNFVLVSFSNDVDFSSSVDAACLESLVAIGVDLSDCPGEQIKEKTNFIIF